VTEPWCYRENGTAFVAMTGLEAVEAVMIEHDVE
jgi:hypothetical protein